METTVIEMPKLAKYNTIQNVKLELRKVVKNKENAVIFDFQKCVFIYPDAIVALSIWFQKIHERQQEFTITIRYDTENESNDVIMYLSKIGFLKENYFIFDKPPKNFRGKCVPITRIEGEENNNQALFQIRELLGGQEFAALSNAVSEVVMNVFHHSQSNICYVCAQTYSRDDSIVITIADGGIGYKKQLKNTYPYINDDETALKVAMSKKMTGNLDKNRNNSGMGLYLTAETMLKNRGELCIHSGYAMYEQIQDDKQYKKSEVDWKGVLVSLKYYINNPVSMKDVNDAWDFKDDDYNEFLDLFC